MENKKRLIYADEIRKKAVPHTRGEHGYNANIRKWVVLVGDIDDAPTIDAVEVVHGRWKYYHKQNIAVCTNCSFERKLDADFGKAVSCPNCGAKMDGDGNGNL